MYGINYDGLRKKDTYNELIDYVMNKQKKIKYPNRTAKFLRESPQLSNLLDGDGEGVLAMEEQQKKTSARSSNRKYTKGDGRWGCIRTRIKNCLKTEFIANIFNKSRGFRF